MENCAGGLSRMHRIRPAGRILRAASTWAILVLGTLALTACGDSRSLRWKEDVKLPDGRVVTLDRYQEFKGPYYIGVGEGPTESNYWFEFKHPDTGEKVRWESDRDLKTLVLMMDGPAPVLLTSPWWGSSMFRYRCPNPPYLLFRHEAGGWKQVAVGLVPVKRLQVNMTFSPSAQRALIRDSDHRLGVGTTQASRSNGRPYVINFALMTEQTFTTKNCDSESDDLIDSSSPGEAR